MKSLSSALGKLSITTNSQKSKPAAAAAAPRQASQNSHIHSNPATSQAMFVQDMGSNGDLQYNGAAHNHAIAFMERNAKADREKEVRQAGLLERSLQANNGRPRALRDPSKPAEGNNILEFPNSAGFLWVASHLGDSSMSHQFVDTGMTSNIFNMAIEDGVSIHKSWVAMKNKVGEKNMMKYGWESDSANQVNKGLTEYNMKFAENRVPVRFFFGVDAVTRTMGYRVDFPTSQRQVNSWFKEYDDYKDQKPGWNQDLFKY